MSKGSCPAEALELCGLGMGMVLALHVYVSVLALLPYGLSPASLADYLLSCFLALAASKMKIIFDVQASNLAQ